MLKKDFVFSISDLKKYLSEKGFQHVILPLDYNADNFFLLIPKYYLDLINWDDTNDPLLKMVLTSNLEKDIKKYELEDPIGDKKNTPVPGIIHRHNDRCLLNLTSACAIHCRFCFRKKLLSGSKINIDKSIKYIRAHTEIWEVIFSGGDPFILTDHFLQSVITKLQSIPQVKVFRFHTRTPVVYPKRITNNLISILKKIKSSTVVLHINHPKEITGEFIRTVNKLKKATTHLLSQTVLLKGVNDSSEILTELYRKLVEIGVKPYHLYHLDFTAGTDHFRVSIKSGKNIFQQLRNSLSGVCLPTYVVDIPGGYGKVPVLSLVKTSTNSYQGKTYDGKDVTYADPAA